MNQIINDTILASGIFPEVNKLILDYSSEFYEIKYNDFREMDWSDDENDKNVYPSFSFVCRLSIDEYKKLEKLITVRNKYTPRFVKIKLTKYLPKSYREIEKYLIDSEIDKWKWYFERVFRELRKVSKEKYVKQLKENLD